MKKVEYLLLCFFLMMGCGERQSRQTAENPVEKESLPYEVRMTVEHDPNAFTQGLVYHQDKIIESTGGDSSWIAEYDVTSGTYERKVTLNQNYFGEGITVLNGKLYQLTWQSKTGFVYDVNTFEKLREFSYDFEGWGITHDNQHLIISDGTDKLHYFDTLSLEESFVKSVKNNNRKASKLNELELIDGYIYANQWQTNYILKIDTATAEVVQELNLDYLAGEIAKRNPEADVLNGIAYDANTGDVFITGKLWPRLYVIRLKD
ncbi:glutaminyl-peptide cyclotransferase [Catalinimonas niigatensis]|uniref:glutaminyl-peptide cyclotransferase n=1 Tax=Catalinimonas niigatensis TaxID=1397264 RepID=UPI0026664B43|nr:glutaminyl-peptide cyclotransferase [Catalinimonas niigatensis]WPP52114.1 glutaminyl-peptide cyclotransferase [Catalinimonas niigatensis]